MPGGYAHITLINQMRERVDARADVPVNVKIALGDYLGFCELGGVSPDFPYLDVLDNNAASWADNMHWHNTGATIQAGVRRVIAMTGAEQTKCLAWLMGYSAHVTADVTIHPIVELKVGKYEDHKTEHRICEMHQDAFIFQRLNLSKIGLSEHLDREHNGIMSCHHPEDVKRMDASVHALWDGMLHDVHPGAYAQTPPQIDRWHACFGPRVDIIEEGSALPAFARHVAVDAGLTYPEPTEVDNDEFINQLKTPEGLLDYDIIFDRARDNVATVWSWIGHDVQNGGIDQSNAIGQWNLDTGRDENGKLVFWSEMEV